MSLKDSSSIQSYSSSKSSSSIWSKLSKLIHRHSKKRRNSASSQHTTGHYSSSSTLSDESVHTIDSEESHNDKKHRKPLVADNSSAPMVIPPFSPTYCKANEFPYSNFYVKLPDGRWMIRYRDGNREILRTDFMEGYMI